MEGWSGLHIPVLLQHISLLQLAFPFAGPQSSVLGIGGGEGE